MTTGTNEFTAGKDYYNLRLAPQTKFQEMLLGMKRREVLGKLLKIPKETLYYVITTYLGDPDIFRNLKSVKVEPGYYVIVGYYLVSYLKTEEFSGHIWSETKKSSCYVILTDHGLVLVVGSDTSTNFEVVTDSRLTFAESCVISEGP